MAIRRMNNDFLVHHGILGMRWGYRRYQNPDGSLNEAGRKRYHISDMSDKTPEELKKEIARSNLEARYAAALTNSTTKKQAKTLAKNFFDVTSKTLATTSTVTGLADKSETGQAFSKLAKIGSEGSKIGQEAFNISDKTAAVYKRELAQFSDEELKKMVDRVELERKYEDEVKNKKLNDTMITVNNMLGTVGSLVGITAASLAIYTTILSMRSNGQNQS